MSCGVWRGTGWGSIATNGRITRGRNYVTSPMRGHQQFAKLAAPRAIDIVRRARVSGFIGEALRSGRCWLAAPAGYGKTTALVDYLQTNPAPHVWFRIDDGDQDIAQFFHYLAHALEAPEAAATMPVFGPEYAEQPLDFARKFFRAFFAHLAPSTLLVLDDLHHADTPSFRSVLAVLFRELPDTVRCACLSRTLPDGELKDFLLYEQLQLIDQSVLEFSEDEARSLIEIRLKNIAASIDISPARGWAVGLILLADRGGAPAAPATSASLRGQPDALFDALGRHFFLSLPEADRDTLLKLNILPEIRSDLANAMVGTKEGERLLERLLQRQLLITRAEASRDLFHLHDLLREFLDRWLEHSVPKDEQRRLRERAAVVLRDGGYVEEAIPLALQAEAWTLAHDLILSQAETVLCQGRRSTFIDWSTRLPDEAKSPWILYWLGVAHMPDDASAEHWLAKAWMSFRETGDQRGECLTVARAVLVKADSWRTHDGLSAWTGRAVALLDRGLPQLPPGEAMLVRIGMIRALDFADDFRSTSAPGRTLTAELLERLSSHAEGSTPALRLMASEALIEHAVMTGEAIIFEQAVDSVLADLRDDTVSPWVLGLWLVAFGAANGRYFPYVRRGFPYEGAEHALRAAIEIGEREGLRGVEFGALYHLQLVMKLRNDFAEFAVLVTRLAEIADSRFTTQVAVVADCHAAMHARQGDFAEAYRDCDRFMTAIEAANEPIMERLPHFITQYQVLLADRRPGDAAALLQALLPLLDGGALQRTRLCILAAEAAEARWASDPAYDDRLRALIDAFRAANWTAVLLNLPELLAVLMADAIERDINAEFCRSVIRERRLTAPEGRPAHWPWLLRIHLLGGFRLELDRTTVQPSAKAPTRALDILRILALSKGHVCSLEKLQDWLWPDLDGDQAKAAYEQALHRLRKFLGQAELVIQRDGLLRLAPDKVWVDLPDWEARVRDVVPAEGGDVPLSDREGLIFGFPGPLLQHGPETGWSAPARERVRTQFLDLAMSAGKEHQSKGRPDRARTVYLRALEAYPDSARMHQALIADSLGRQDTAGAVEDYARYQRALNGDTPPLSPPLMALIRPLLGDDKRA